MIGNLFAALTLVFLRKWTHDLLANQKEGAYVGNF